jgi:ATP-dependent Clp protease ATP-binding subunit ClpA
MFERFTDRARTVVKQAQVEARQLRHDRVGTEHLLLALLAEGEGLAARALHESGADYAGVRARIVAYEGTGPRLLGDADAAALKEIGIDLDAVRRKVEASFGEGALRPPEMFERRGRFGRRVREYVGGTFSPRAKKVLELSLREALRLKHNYIGTEHILLGLIREGGGLGALVLTEAGITLDDLRERTLAVMRAAA